MAQDISSITRKGGGLAVSVSLITLAGADNAYAQAQTTPEKSLYECLAECSPTKARPLPGYVENPKRG